MRSPMVTLGKLPSPPAAVLPTGVEPSAAYIWTCAPASRTPPRDSAVSWKPLALLTAVMAPAFGAAGAVMSLVAETASLSPVPGRDTVT